MSSGVDSVTTAVQPSDQPARCPQCKRGVVLETTFGWWCSRRYASRRPCGWEKGEPGLPPLAASPKTATEHARHVRKHNRAIYRAHGALDSRRCDRCGAMICCAYGQRFVVDPRAPGGVWLLHPSCRVPERPQ